MSCPRVHHRVHKSRPLLPFLSQKNLVRALAPCFFNTRYPPFLSSVSRCSKPSVYFRFFHHGFICISIRATCPAHFIHEHSKRFFSFIFMKCFFDTGIYRSSSVLQSPCPLSCVPLLTPTARSVPLHCVYGGPARFRPLDLTGTPQFWV
jgi:hypothetical protein